MHFRWTVGIKFIGLVALASLLAVEWYSEVRSEASRLVTELSSLGKAGCECIIEAVEMARQTEKKLIEDSHPPHNPTVRVRDFETWEDVLLYDLVLTMSARMLALTGRSRAREPGVRLEVLNPSGF